MCRRRSYASINRHILGCCKFDMVFISDLISSSTASSPIWSLWMLFRMYKPSVDDCEDDVFSSFDLIWFQGFCFFASDITSRLSLYRTFTKWSRRLWNGWLHININKRTIDGKDLIYSKEMCNASIHQWMILNTHLTKWISLIDPSSSNLIGSHHDNAQTSFSYLNVVFL